MAAEGDEIRMKLDASGVRSGGKQAEAAIAGVDGRVRDARGRFIAMGNAAKQAGADALAGGKQAEAAASYWQRLGQIGARAGSSIATGINGIGNALTPNSYKLMQFGQFMDDLQYVPEMGLRPIVGQLVQMNPVLGTTVIIASQLVKHLDQVTDFGGGLAKYWGLDEANAKSGLLADTWRDLGKGVSAVSGYFKQLGEGIDALSGGEAKRDKASTEKYLGDQLGTGADRDKGAGMVKSIDEYGRAKALSDMISKQARKDPSLRAGAPNQRGRINEVAADLIALIERAAKGDTNAISMLGTATRGTGVGRKILADTPGGQRAAKDAQERDQSLAQKEATDMKSKAEGFASDMQEVFTKKFVEGITQSEDTVREELEKTMPADKAAWFANQVFTTLEKGAKDAINARARKMGVTSEEAQARMAAEGVERRARPITLEQQMGKGAVGREDQIMTRISDRTGSQGAVADFIATARQNRFLNLNYQRKFGKMGFEQQLDETSKLNARDDEMARQLEQRRLTKMGYTPARAAMIAEQNVATERKRLNGETHDVDSKPQNKLIDNTKELNDTLRTLIRTGIVARFG